MKAKHIVFDNILANLLTCLCNSFDEYASIVIEPGSHYTGTFSPSMGRTKSGSILATIMFYVYICSLISYIYIMFKQHKQKT